MDIHDALREFLTEIMSAHVGINNPISTREIDAKASLRFPWEKNINRKWRKVAEETKLPIHGRSEKACSVGKGYFIPDGPDEARRAALFLTSYMTALSRRRKAIIDAYPAAGVGVQQEFPW